MINATREYLVFIETGGQLSANIIAALRLASRWMLQAYGLEAIDLGRVNTKTHKEAIFPALVDRFILRKKNAPFTEEYVLSAFEFVNAEVAEIPQGLYSRLTIAQTYGKWAYRKSHFSSLRRGFSAFLVALHIQRSVVLPCTFKWPMGFTLGAKGQITGRREICSLDDLPELLRFLCSLNFRAKTQKESVFNTYNHVQQKRISEHSLHLVLAAGWLVPEDANYDELVELYRLNETTRFAKTPHLACLMLADLIASKYKLSSPIDGEGWQKHLSRSRALSASTPKIALLDRAEKNSSILEQAVTVPASQMVPELVGQMTRLPGLKVDVAALTKTWLALESQYLKKVKRESNKGRLTAIGHLNAYLFFYLPYWFDAHPGFSYEFPDSPTKLLSAVFVSDLGLLDAQERPVTLVDFMATVAADRKWNNATHYGNLKQLEVFFTFIERIGSQLPECTGFRQPLSGYDFPPTARSFGTNKRPIPRRIFKFYLCYLEALVSYFGVLLRRVLSGEVTDSDLASLSHYKATVIDCFVQQHVFGCIPIVSHQGKVLPLRRVPNILFLNSRKLKDGRTLRIPHPHALHQIQVALYTGIRHNHIQWLNAETFDSRTCKTSQTRMNA